MCNNEVQWNLDPSFLHSRFSPFHGSLCEVLSTSKNDKLSLIHRFLYSPPSETMDRGFTVHYAVWAFLTCDLYTNQIGVPKTFKTLMNSRNSNEKSGPNWWSQMFPPPFGYHSIVNSCLWFPFRMRSPYKESQKAVTICIDLYRQNLLQQLAALLMLCTILNDNIPRHAASVSHPHCIVFPH